MKGKIILIVLVTLCTRHNSFSQENTLKIMTYNIWNGFDWGKDTERRSNLVDWVDSQKTDIIALQELCNYTPEKLAEDAKGWGHDYSVLLKTTCYSVGLTSKYPIEVKERIIDNMWHGALQCKTAGVDIFVIHFWPGDRKYIEEIAIVLERLKKVRTENSNYIVLGDFNAQSPMDADLYTAEKGFLSVLREKKKDPTFQIDYEAMSTLLAFPLIDVTQMFTRGVVERGTAPGLILGPVNKETSKELVARLNRIDYILTSPELGKKCTGSTVHNGENNWFLSDHYPVTAEFNLEE